MLDGVDNNETWLQTVVIFPSVDALDEFKLQTCTYSAEFGRSLGGVVNLQIKSGTNTLRGSAFEFHRNDAFDANNFFNNRAGRAEAGLQAEPVRRHARRPDLQGQDVLLRRLPGAPRDAGPDVPVDRADARRCAAGDFSELNRVIYDPLTGQPFPGNIIPADRIDPVARNILTQLYPEPNTAGTRQAERADDQQLPDQPDQGAAGQPVRRQGRSQPDARTTGSSPATASRRRTALQPATLPHGDAGRDLRRRRRQHQGAEPRLQRHPDAAATTG